MVVAVWLRVCPELWSATSRRGSRVCPLHLVSFIGQSSVFRSSCLRHKARQACNLSSTSQSSSVNRLPRHQGGSTESAYAWTVTITSIFRRYWGKYIQNVCVSVAQLCLILCDLMGCSLCSSVHGILQARILEWKAIPFSRGSSWPGVRTHIACIAGGFLTVWATREANIQNSKRKLCHVRLLPVCLPFVHLSIHPSLPHPSSPSIHSSTQKDTRWWWTHSLSQLPWYFHTYIHLSKVVEGVHFRCMLVSILYLNLSKVGKKEGTQCISVGQNWWQLTQPSMENGWSMAYSCKGMVLSNGKEQTLHTHNVGKSHIP